MRPAPPPNGAGCRRAFTLAGAAALLTACDPGSEAAFTAGRGYDPCIQVLEACPDFAASCVLDDDNFTRRYFPGAIGFVVNADPDADIEVMIYLAEQRDAGVSTRIYWNEPGCSDYQAYDSAGRNVFAEAEDTNVFRKKKTVREGGEHLVEIVTDMQARATIAVSVHEPGS